MLNGDIERKISTELKVLLEKLKGAATTTRELIIKICNQGKNEGLTNQEIRNLIIFSVSPLISGRTIRKLLPLELKKQRMIRDKSLRHVMPQLTSDTQEGREDNRKDAVIEGLQKQAKEKDVMIEYLEEQNAKLKEQTKDKGGIIKVKVGVTQLWRELILLRNSNVLYASILCNGNSFVRLEPF
jgi:hypothetical protein